MKIRNNYGVISIVSDRRGQEMIERGEGKELIEEIKEIKKKAMPEPEAVTEDISLEDMTYPELKKKASALGINTFRKNKEDLINILKGENE